MGFIADTYPVKLTTPLTTDAYHFSTPYAYWLEGRADNPSVFYMFGRKEALNGGYSIAGGLEGVIDIVQRWQDYGFTEDDIEFLRSQKTLSGKQKYPDEFLEYIQNVNFKLKIDAAPEGTAFFPQEPVLRVEGPLFQVKILESAALCLVNGHSGYITQGARQADVLTIEMKNGSPKGVASVQGLRRGPALGAALEASRSLGAGGYTSSSTGTAAKLYGQTFAGTMDHAWIMTHENELADLTLSELFKLRDNKKGKELKEIIKAHFPNIENKEFKESHRLEILRSALKKDAFRSFAFAHPESGVLLVDTYDPIQGLENAIIVIKELKELGLGQGYGVRFDSGDITAYSKLALRRFAEEGWVDGVKSSDVDKLSDEDLLKLSDKCSVFVAPADGINEYTSKQMRENGAFAKSWGIGTAGSHVPPLGLVYKAASFYMDTLKGDKEIDAEDMTPVMKVASNAPVKSSNPGKLNSRRFIDENGMLSHVVIYDENLGFHQDGKKVNLRDFNQVSKGKTQLYSTEDLLVPVFDSSGNYVFKEPPKKPAYSGSKHMVTDLSAISKRITKQLKMLPEDVRLVAKPKDDILKERLLDAFNKAKAAGKSRVQVNLNTLESYLPPAVGHIPVYLDYNLYLQRLSCEKKHLNHKGKKTTGVDSYHERFENTAAKPVIK